MNLGQYTKALVPLGVAVVLGVLSNLGITSGMNLQDFVTLVITSGLVYLFPNQKA